MTTTYIAKVLIQAGEYEKTSRFLVVAESKALAEDYAVYSESHGPDSLDWAQRAVFDLGGEFAYTASVEQVRLDDLCILEKYLPTMTADVSELLASGNYKQHRTTNQKSDSI
ncbi:hypothetical protein QUN99_003420 [Vibrio parahaemolyticus]|nr:hypothetical protein [Vibrio parahaemolyticus]